MKEKFSKLIDIFKLVRRSRKLRNAETDWKMMMYVFIGLVVVVSVLNTLMFLKINKGDFLAENKTKQTIEDVLNPSVLAETIKHYEDKGNSKSIFDAKRLTDVDPSL